MGRATAKGWEAEAGSKQADLWGTAGKRRVGWRGMLQVRSGVYLALSSCSSAPCSRQDCWVGARLHREAFGEPKVAEGTEVGTATELQGERRALLHWILAVLTHGFVPQAFPHTYP